MNKEQEYYEALRAAFDVIELLLPAANRDDEAVMKALRHLQVKTWTLPVFKAEFAQDNQEIRNIYRNEET